MNELTPLEDSKLSEIEERIAKNEPAALQYIEDFRTIRDERLYRDEFKTFADYCQSKWAKSYRSINRSIEAQEVRKELTNANPDLGHTASQTSDRTIHTMKKLKPKRRPAVFQKAKKLAGANPITPSHIHASTTERDYSGAYSSPKPPTHATRPPPEPLSPSTITAQVPPPLNPDTISHLEAIYSHHKAWLNDLPLKSPRQILDCLINHL